MKIRNVILTTDFSASARGAYAAAVDLVRHHQARLDLVHSTEFPPYYAGFEFGPTQKEITDFQREIARTLEEECRREEFSGLEVESHVLQGYGPEVVCEHAATRGADLIVQGSHGYAGFKRFLLGSFAERVLRLATVPVLTWRSTTETDEPPAAGFQVKRVLLPYDFSALSGEALEAVRLLARSYSAAVTVVYVLHDLAKFPPLPGMTGKPVEQEMLHLIDEVPALILDRLQEFAKSELEGLDHDCDVLKGDPAPSLLAKAEELDADVICMATHGRSGLRRMFLGSVAEKVLRGAHCPVLTVRPAASEVADDFSAHPPTTM